MMLVILVFANCVSNVALLPLFDHKYIKPYSKNKIIVTLFYNAG